MANRLRPLWDRVLVQRVVAQPKTAGGVLLPDSAKSVQNNEAVIMNMGNDAFRDDGSLIPMAPKPGDRVLLSEFAGQTIKFDDDHEYVLVRDKDIIAEIREEKH